MRAVESSRTLRQRHRDVAVLLEELVPCVERHAEPAADAEHRAPAVPEPHQLVRARRSDLPPPRVRRERWHPGAITTSPSADGVSKLVYQLIPVITGRSTRASSAFSIRTRACTRRSSRAVWPLCRLRVPSPGVVRRIWIALELCLQLVEGDRVRLGARRSAGEVGGRVQRPAEGIGGARADVSLVEGKPECLMQNARDRGRAVCGVVPRARVVQDVPAEPFARRHLLRDDRSEPRHHPWLRPPDDECRSHCAERDVREPIFLRLRRGVNLIRRHALVG